MEQLGGLEISVFPPNPFSMIITGVSRSGKSEFLKKFLMETWPKENPTDHKIKKIICINRYNDQPVYRALTDHFGPKLEFSSSYSPALLKPPMQDMDVALKTVDAAVPETDEGAYTFVIFDDVADQICNDPNVACLYTGACHHERIMPICLVQNLFFSSQVIWRTISRNATCLVLFANPRDANIYSVLNRQIYGFGKPNLVLRAWDMACSDMHRFNNCEFPYLVVNLQVNLSSRLRLSTGQNEPNRILYAIEGAMDSQNNPKRYVLLAPERLRELVMAEKNAMVNLEQARHERASRDVSAAPKPAPIEQQFATIQSNVNPTSGVAAAYKSALYVPAPNGTDITGGRLLDEAHSLLQLLPARQRTNSHHILQYLSLLPDSEFAVKPVTLELVIHGQLLRGSHLIDAIRPAFKHKIYSQTISRTHGTVASFGNRKPSNAEQFHTITEFEKTTVEHKK